MNQLDELFQQHSSSRGGISEKEAKQRLEQYGPNAIIERKQNLFLKALGYFWGPIPWMIEAAAILSLLIHHWADFTLIVVLLIFNAAVAFFQEYQAGNAIEALKKKLAVKSRVLRDGAWREIAAQELVPGDVIRVRLGDIIPADAIPFEGEYLSVDQSVLTGESLPVTKKIGDILYSGSIAQKGEMVCLVTATGKQTYFGKTAKLVEEAKPVSHFQKAVLRIGDFLIYICLGLVSLLIVVQIARHAPIFSLLKFSLILTVASIPVAMPAVLSVTMAVGALVLAKMKAIVSRLESIEEMAGIDTLCSDKTGTLTYNKLTLGTPAIFSGATDEEIIFAAALASKLEDLDPIDKAIIDAVHDSEKLKEYSQQKFVPFDPVSKKTEALIRNPQGTLFRTTKGAPQVILALCKRDAAFEEQVNQKVSEFAKKGYRTLGVARAEQEGEWQFLGLLPLFDRVRDDSKETIQKASEHGVEVKMLTGDNLAIAQEVSSELGIGNNIFNAAELAAEKNALGLTDVAEKVERANGFAQVYPENKFLVVKALQAKDHIVGMTGDGVNDAPALKQADLGIAVSGATDAARAAASLVLTAPGLSVIIAAIEEARRIFERMNTYAIYRVTETIRV
ncbi:MAG: plasma-membrane proton-efflux P-type ATPase, partial [Verrucomicrobia bacterium]|nr:plasma-membrane proton-efflux P-type ATPase [Verrucomicrobiota bacterium]